jgi:hypothetical protein
VVDSMVVHGMAEITVSISMCVLVRVGETLHFAFLHWK